MNITITINEDKEVKVEKVQPDNKPKIFGKPFCIRDMELANYLLDRGFSIQNIAYSDKPCKDGMAYFFYNSNGIGKAIKKYESNIKINDDIDDINLDIDNLCQGIDINTNESEEMVDDGTED